ncbi:cell division protein FtsX [Acanthopleuribacter pedis]|uniref:Cell division protein FtsX n=1 Tax=Acanthopleuribacter pedis TaxID=442870 RepID=A0A8J7QDZ2_9BACT|nr:permease-like cell division protein FtsX [Acanthopleuribacter pedis]MBO1317870.1 ABC transporter permease [Acanthopleuribacter pedis]
MLQFLYFSFSEAITSLWRTRILNLLSLGTIMFAMFILGSFMFVGLNLQNLALDWQKQIQFNIFLTEEITEEERAEIQAYLGKSFFIDTFTYLSKDQARMRFDEKFAAYDKVTEGLEDNPFPASFEVFLLRGTKQQTYTTLKDELSTFGGIEEVYYDEEIFKRLGMFAGFIQMAGWFFGVIVIFSSIFTISNVLKLTFFTRREEVDIMKLVGASRAYIRGPFIIEGVLQGLLGASAGVALVYAGYLAVNHFLTGNATFILGNLEPEFLPLQWVFLILFAGAFSGLLGSLFSLHQFLEEHISYH